MKLLFLISGSAFAIALATSGCASHPSKPATAKNAEAKPTQRVAPVYPATAQIHNAEGDVRLCFTVDTNGRVKDTRIVKLKLYTIGRKRPSRQDVALLETAAIDAIRQWRFDPRYINGKPVKAPDICQTMRFRLR